MKVYTKTIEGHQVIHYEYDTCQDFGFCFNLLCEVGEPWQDEAKRGLMALLDRTGCEVIQVELYSAPWYADVLAGRVC